MSDPKDAAALEELQKNIAEEEKYENLKHDTSKKKAVIEAAKVDAQMEKLEQDRIDMKLAKEANYDVLSAEQLAVIQQANDDYIAASRSPMKFINDTFDGVVPFFRKNLILIGAKTGEGKSTAVANIAYRVQMQKHPETGKRLRTLILTNEERAEDVYNRITALQMGWSYTNHSKFTDEQARTFTRAIPVWSKDGVVTVVDNNHGGSHGVTTSLEGIESVFEKLIKDGVQYDVIIIDYYQNIIYSQKDQHMSENDVQARLARMLDRYKNQYAAPITIMAQMNPPDDQDRTPWQQRIKGRKIIADSCTFVVEMSANFEDRATAWKVWKSRFTESIGKTYHTGWENGKYVPYSEEFILKVNALKESHASRELDKTIGLQNIKPKEGEPSGTES